MKKDYDIGSVALIDTGIQKTKEMEDKIIGKVSFCDSTREKTIANEHGTVCAKIILKICPQLKFWDLQIFRENGNTEIAVLLNALEWCIEHKIKLIHLSLGTIDYFDKGILKEVILRLIEQGTIIVAAYHNANIKTYPASFSGVFGVRQDREGILNNYQFMFQEQDGIEIGNTLIAHWWEENERTYSNSYAAPVVTGYIAKFLKEKPQAEFVEILEFMQKCAVNNTYSTQKISKILKVKGDIEIPIVCGLNFSKGIIKSLIEMFQKEGYQVLLLQENVTELQAVPIQEYWGNEVSWEEILYTVYRIYGGDIIFLDITLKEENNIKKCQGIDLYVEYCNGTYQFYNEKIEMEVKTINEMFKGIYAQFQE